MARARAFAMLIGIAFFVTAGCSDPGAANRIPTGASPVAVAERRVGDVSGTDPGDGVFCLDFAGNAADRCQWLFTAADGDQIYSRAGGGTGRFEGAAISDDTSSLRPRPGSLDVTIVVRLPARNDAFYLISGRLGTDLTTILDPGCATGVRFHLAVTGDLPYLGATSGFYSFCRPADPA